MKLTAITGITLGKGQGTAQLQNQNLEPIEAGTSHAISFKIGETKTGLSKPTTQKGTLEAIGKSKNDYTLTLSKAIEPNETIEIDFTLPITVKKDIAVSVTTETKIVEIPAQNSEKKWYESTEPTTPVIEPEIRNTEKKWYEA